MVRSFRHLGLAAILALSFAWSSKAQVNPCAEKGFDGKIAVQTNAINTHPDDARGYVRRAWFYHKQGKDVLALTDLDKALVLDARSAEAFEFRGRIFAHQGKYAKAINDFTQAIQTDDKRATAFYSRGRSYQFTSKSSLAVMDFQKTVELEPERKYAYHGLGMELVKIGRPNEAQLVWNNAVDDLTRKIESAQEGTCSFEQYFWRGMILRSAKRYNLALEDLNKAIELKPSEYETYYYRGLLYFDIQAKDQAIADFSKSIELNPLFAENYASRASVNDAIRDSKAAERDRKKFKELSEGK